jgi:hypothetical protein
LVLTCFAISRHVPHMLLHIPHAFSRSVNEGGSGRTCADY